MSKRRKSSKRNNSEQKGKHMTKGIQSGTNVVPVVINGGKVKQSTQEQPWCRMLKREEGVISPFLYDILEHATPHKYEDAIIPLLSEYVKPHVLEKDAFGNCFVRVGENYTTMFSCHLDTVHKAPGKISLMLTEGSGSQDGDGFVYASTIEKIYKYKFPTEEKSVLKWELDRDCDQWFGKGLWGLQLMDGETDKFHIIAYENKDDKVGQVCDSTHIERVLFKEITNPSILGADDKVGVYICGRLIRNNTPGLYVFHLGEECGGLGSTWIKDKNPDFVKGIQRCIAFDRMNYDDVIAFQGDRTASKEFTEALAEAINAGITAKQKLKGDQRGVWTDSANYTGLIPECTNVSVGYFKQHWVEEHFDAIWLEQILLPALLKVDFETLPTVRKPDPNCYAIKGVTRTYNYGTRYNRQSDFDWETWNGSSYLGMNKNRHGNIPVSPKWVTAKTPFLSLPDWEPVDGWLEGATKEGMTRIVYGHLLSSQESSIKAAGLIVESMLEYDDQLDRHHELRKDHTALQASYVVLAKQADAQEIELDEVKKKLEAIQAELSKLRSLH